MTATDELIEEYLGRLSTAVRGLPPARRTELMTEIEQHIGIVLSQSEDQSEATVRTILDRLGTPEDIAREALAGADAPAARRRIGAFELVTVLLLLIGGIVIPVLGWIVGAVLLWASVRWTTRDKLIGTLVFPGGLAAVGFFFLWGSSETCTADGTCETSGLPAGLAVTLTLVGVVGSIGSAGYLLRRAGTVEMSTVE